jgi:PKD repeat protein
LYAVSGDYTVNLKATKVSGTDSKLATINVLTPVQGVQQIITAVQSLDLNKRQANSFIVKLNAAITDLSAGNPKKAINELNAFNNEVKDYVNNGVLSSSQGQALTDETNSVINALKAS